MAHVLLQVMPAEATVAATQLTPMYDLLSEVVTLVGKEAVICIAAALVFAFQSWRIPPKKSCSACSSATSSPVSSCDDRTPRCHAKCVCTPVDGWLDDSKPNGEGLQLHSTSHAAACHENLSDEKRTLRQSVRRTLGVVRIWGLVHSWRTSHNALHETVSKCHQLLVYGSACVGSLSQVQYSGKQWLLLVSQTLAVLVSVVLISLAGFVVPDISWLDPGGPTARGHLATCVTVFFAGALMNCRSFFGIPVA